MGLEDGGFYHNVKDKYIFKISLFILSLEFFFVHVRENTSSKIIFCNIFRFKERGEEMRSQFCTWRRLRWFGGGDIFGARRDTDGPECSLLLTTAEDSFTEASQEYWRVSENFKLRGKLSFSFYTPTFYVSKWNICLKIISFQKFHKFKNYCI